MNLSFLSCRVPDEYILHNRSALLIGREVLVGVDQDRVDLRREAHAQITGTGICLAPSWLSARRPMTAGGQGQWRRLRGLPGQSPRRRFFFEVRWMNEPSVGPLAWVNGSDAPEKTEINLGFMALSDCASVVVAATQGFAQPYGLTLNLKRQSSWANLRDRPHAAGSAC